jgi:hypothetical protein
MVSDHLKGTWASLILYGLDVVSASMAKREKIPVKEIEEIRASLAVVATSEQALHFFRVVG